MNEFQIQIQAIFNASDNVKQTYVELCKQYHPDSSKQDTHEQFCILQKVWNTINIHQNRNEDCFNGIIQKIITLDAITIEIIGDWIWVTGSTYQHKETLKAHGFKYHAKKKCWFYTENPVSFVSKETTMDQIRAKYGSTVVKGIKEIKH